MLKQLTCILYDINCVYQINDMRSVLVCANHNTCCYEIDMWCTIVVLMVWEQNTTIDRKLFIIETVISHNVNSLIVFAVKLQVLL